MKISIEQLLTLIEMYSKKYSKCKNGDGLVHGLADLFAYEVKIPIDYMQIFAGLL